MCLVRKNHYSAYARNELHLYRQLYMDSGAQNFSVTTRYAICSAVIFSDLIYTYNRRYKIDKVNMHL